MLSLKSIFLWITALILISLMSGCSHLKTRVTQEFKTFPESERVHYQEGAEELAHYIADHIEEWMIETEMAQYRHFEQPEKIQVYVFNQAENYADYGYAHINTRVRASTNDIYISPLILEQIETLPNILMHEMSHIHLRQFIGTLTYVKDVPDWFHEGVATDSSNGAGAEKVTIDEAIEAFKQGKHFEPSLEASLLGHKTVHNYDLTPQMYYRQTQLFIMFLKAYNSNSFRDLYVSLTKKQSFKTVWKQHYGKELPELWDVFMEQLKSYQKEV